ncbi:MAG: hypothetical protein R2911_03845 [Caldilineaceae bacterium]
MKALRSRSCAARSLRGGFPGGVFPGSPEFDIESGGLLSVRRVDRASALLDELGLEDSDGNGTRNFAGGGEDIVLGLNTSQDARKAVCR